MEEWLDDMSVNSLGQFVGNAINTYVTTTLNQSDSAVSGQFVTAVSETAGKITVSRAAIKAEDITRPDNTNPLSVDVGGTGRTSFTSGEVLIGNGTSGILSRAITDTTPTDNSISLITAGAAKAYVDAQTQALSNNLARVMHFRGIATVSMDDVETNRQKDPQISGYTTWEAGDVILDNGKEYIYTGPGNSNGWQLIGDETGWVVHGEIVDADIASNANISQSKINGLTTALNNKVDKEEGKGLSTNDYTNADKGKLTNIEAGAQVNDIEHIYVQTTANGTPSELTITDKSVTIDLSNVGQVKGAQVPTADGTSTENITLNASGKLEFARIAKTGDVADLLQPLDQNNQPITVLVFDCGNAGGWPSN